MSLIIHALTSNVIKLNCLELRAYMSNYIPYKTMGVITYQYPDISLCLIVEDLMITRAFYEQHLSHTSWYQIFSTMMKHLYSSKAIHDIKTYIDLSAQPIVRRAVWATTFFLKRRPNYGIISQGNRLYWTLHLEWVMYMQFLLLTLFVTICKTYTYSQMYVVHTD